MVIIGLRGRKVNAAANDNRNHSGLLTIVSASLVSVVGWLDASAWLDMAAVEVRYIAIELRIVTGIRRVR